MDCLIWRNVDGTHGNYPKKGQGCKFSRICFRKSFELKYEVQSNCFMRLIAEWLILEIKEAKIVKVMIFQGS